MEVSPHVRGSKTVLNPGIEQLFGIFLSNFLAFSEQNLERPIRDSRPRIPDSSYWIPVFARRTWILDSNRLWDSGFLELYSRFQGPAKFSRIPEFGFPYVGLSDPISDKRHQINANKYPLLFLMCSIRRRLNNLGV